MAIALDGSTPAALNLPGSSAATATSASFSPPAGSMVVIQVNLCYSSGPGAVTVTAADSNSTSYTAGPTKTAGSFEYSYIFSHYYSSAPGSITVHATRSTTGNVLFQVNIWVLTGAASSQTGAASATSATGSTTNIYSAITTTTTGSWTIAGAACQATETGFTGVNSTTVDNWYSDGGGSTGVAGHAVTGTPGSTNIGWTCSTAVTTAAWLALEILPVAGTDANITTSAFNVSASFVGPTISSGSGSGANISLPVLSVSAAFTAPTVHYGLARVASPSVLPNNILTLPDSDFESGSISWAALTNASTPAVTTAYAYTGTQSLLWHATGAGDTLIASGYYPCRPADGYIFSGYIYAITAVHDTYIGVAWFNSSHVQIGSNTFGADNPTNVANPAQPITWQPITLAATSPAGAAYFKVIVWAGTAVAANELFAIDLMYASNPQAQVLIDFYNPSFDLGSGAGQDFADVSMWVRWDQNVSINHGRQDSISEIQPGAATINLQNDMGWFTPQLSASPYFPNVSLGARTQINVSDPAGNWHTRFDGPISLITYTVDTTGGTNLATVSVADILSYLNRQDPLSCWTKEHVLYDDPWLHWTLNDSGQTGTAAETGGSNGPNLHLVGYQTGSQVASVTWANSNGGVETLADAAAPDQPDGSAYWFPGSVIPSSDIRGLASGAVGPIQTPLETIYFVPALTAQSAQNTYVGTDGYQLNGELYLNGVPTPLVTSVNGNNYTIECWFNPDPGIKAHLGTNVGPFTVLSLGNSRNANCLTASLNLTSGGGLGFQVATWSNPPAFSVTQYGAINSALASFSTTYTPDSVPLPHHLVLEITGISGGGVVVGYLDGAYIGQLTLSNAEAFDTICVGGAFGGHGNFYGNISIVSIYQYLLSGTQTNQHCSAGQYGHWETTTDNCIYWLGQFASIPGYWNNLADQNNGLSLTEYLSADGQTALSTMQLYEKAEQGLLYVNVQGQLSFHTRDWRMGYGAADLVLPADVYTADLGYELIDTALLNEAATASVTYTQGVDWNNVVSQGIYGTYANGTQQSPVSLPLITWSRAYSQLGLQNTTGTSYQFDPTGFGITTSAYGFYPDPNLNDNASWQINTRNTPALICGQLSVDLLTLDPTSGLTVANLYALDIDNVISLSGLPASFPDQPGALDYFIEGVNEIIGEQQWKLTFYTSPAVTQRAWKPGDAAYGKLGVTSRIGVSGPDTSTPAALGKSVSHDAGAPYWPNAFTNALRAYQLGWANATASSINLTPSASTVQGDCILVQVLASGSGGTVSVTDSSSNTYTQIGSVTLSGSQVQYLFASFNANTLSVTNVSSPVITLTASVSQTYTMSAYDLGGITGTDATAATATGTSASPSVTVPTMTHTNDFELAIIANASSDTLSIPSGWTQLGYNFNGVYQNQLFWRQATSTSGDTCNPTMSGSAAWGAIAIPFSGSLFTMNNPSNNGRSFVGANDVRGLAATLQTGLNPPLLVVGLTNHATSYSSGNNGVSNHMIWDTVFIDSIGGMGIVPAWPNWYCVLVPGFYEIAASVSWNAQSSGSAGVRTAWIVVAQAGAQQVAAGLGSPYADTYACPIGEQVAVNNGSIAPVCTPATQIYLGVGDMVGVGVMQTQGSAWQSGTYFGGPMMSLRWVGYGTAQDQVPLALSPGSGTATAAQSRSVYTQTWQSLHTYAYYGTISHNSPQLNNTDGIMYQGQYPASTGGQFAFAEFNYTAIAAALAGNQIKKVYLTMQNTGTYYKTGTELMIGYTTYSGAFGSSFTPGSGTVFNHARAKFLPLQTRKIDITGSGIGDAFKTGGATGLAFGNNSSTPHYGLKTPATMAALDYVGNWAGGTAVSLTIVYAK